MTWLLVLAAYVIGSTPTSHWVALRIHGVDLRTRGSGNLGATNAFRVLGWKTALPVVIVDIAKGWLPVWWFPTIDPSEAWWWALAYGAAAVTGHMFSFWVGFQGGKGVATSTGVLLALAPIALAGAVVLWALLVFTTGIVSLGSVCAALVIPFLVHFTPHRGGVGMTWFAAGLAAAVLWAHRSNIGRLLRREEPRFGGPRESAQESAEGVGGGRG